MRVQGDQIGGQIIVIYASEANHFHLKILAQKFKNVKWKRWVRISSINSYFGAKIQILTYLCLRMNNSSPFTTLHFNGFSSEKQSASEPHCGKMQFVVQKTKLHIWIITILARKFKLNADYIKVEFLDKNWNFATVCECSDNTNFCAWKIKVTLISNRKWT